MPSCSGNDTLAVRNYSIDPRVETFPSLLLDLGPGDDTAVIETVQEHSLLNTGPGRDTVTVGGGASHSLRPVHAVLSVVGENAPGSSLDLFLDDTSAAADTDLNVTQSTVTGSRMLQLPPIRYSVTSVNNATRANKTELRLTFAANAFHVVHIAAAATQFRLSLPHFRSAPALQHTDWLPRGASAGDVAAALQRLLFPKSHGCGSRYFSACAQSVRVAAVDQQYLVTFIGEYRGAPGHKLGPIVVETLPVSPPSPLSTSFAFAGSAGVHYYRARSLQIDAGSGVDNANVRATAAGTQTTLRLHGGNDRVFVSSSANTTVATAAATDVLFGNVDSVLGELWLDFGPGHHRLAVSDRQSLRPKTQAALARSWLDLAPARVHYATDCDFVQGIAIWLSDGDDALRVESLHAPMPSAACPLSRCELTTWTVVHAGRGDDSITTAALNASVDGMRKTEPQPLHRNCAFWSDCSLLCSHG